MSMTVLPLQAAVFTALRADSGLDGLIDGRVYDRPPTGPTFPYITISNSVVNDDGAACIAGEEIFLDLHIWSRSVGSIEAKQIAAAVKSILDEADLTLDSSAALVSLHFQSARFLDDPDGLTCHGVLSFVALTEAT